MGVSPAPSTNIVTSPTSEPSCGGCRRWSAARPSLQRVRPGLFGVPGRRARPRGLAAGGSVPAVTPAHAPCGWPGGGGTDGVDPVSGGWRPAGGHPGPLARTPLPPSFRPLGAGLSFGPSPMVPLLPVSPPPRRAALVGGSGGAPAGARGGGPGYRLVVSGRRVGGAPLPCVSACPAPLAHAHRSPMPSGVAVTCASACVGAATAAAAGSSGGSASG